MPNAKSLKTLARPSTWRTRPTRLGRGAKELEPAASGGTARLEDACYGGKV